MSQQRKDSHGKRETGGSTTTSVMETAHTARESATGMERKKIV